MKRDSGADDSEVWPRRQTGSLPAREHEAGAGPSIQYGFELDSQSIVEQAMRHLEHGQQFNLDDMLQTWERGYVEAALRLTKGNISQAAKLLGINRTTLYSRMESGGKTGGTR